MPALKPPVDKNKPVKPRSSFINFCTNVRSNPSLYGINLADKSLLEQSRILGNAWKDLENSKKDKYIQDYHQDLKNYKEQIGEYMHKIENVKNSVDKSVRETLKSMQENKNDEKIKPKKSNVVKNTVVKKKDTA